jgi:hypothetical protein
MDIDFPVANTTPTVDRFDLAALETNLIWTIFCLAMHPDCVRAGGLDG